MHINRQRPTGVKPENLDMWLSQVIHDAIRDAREAGLDARSIAYMLRFIAKSECRNAMVPLDEGDS